MDEHHVQQFVYPEFTIPDVGNTERSLSDVVQCVESRSWEFPPHQRDFVWPEQKQRDYVNALLGSREHRPVGVIATYHVNRLPHVFVNDGKQRLSTLLKLKNMPTFFGRELDDVLRAFRTTQITVQHRAYRSHWEALCQFKYLNRGTVLDAYEMCSGDLIYMDGYDSVWARPLDDLHSVIDQHTNDLTRVAKQRLPRNKRKRGDYALLLRWIDNSERAVYYQTEPESTEQMLRKVIERDSAVAQQKLKSLLSWVPSEVAMFKEELEAWRSTEPIRAKTVLPEPCVNFLLQLAAHRRCKDVPFEMWRGYVSVLFGYGLGLASPFRMPRLDGRSELLGYVGMNKLHMLEQAANVPFSMWSPLRRAARSQQLAPGYDHSHVKPFSKFGEGETRPELAMANRSRQDRVEAP